MKTIPAFYFDRTDFQSRFESLREEFTKAGPFPHVVIDNFLPPDVFRLLVDEFPGPDSPSWTLWGPGRTIQTKDVRIEKLGLSDETRLEPFTRHFFGQLVSNTFLKILEEISGIGGLIPDPSFNGCGLHSTGPGGRLMIHTDVNRHPFSAKTLHQILNGILYLNPDWKEEYQGHLELWDQNRNCMRRIAPIGNRFVLFYTGTNTYHGHPVPLSCPPNRRRNSIAAYYYIVDRKIGEDYEGFQTSVNWIPSETDDFDTIKWALGVFEKFRIQHADGFLCLNNVFFERYGIECAPSGGSIYVFPEKENPLLAVEHTQYFDFASLSAGLEEGVNSILVLDREGNVHVRTAGTAIRRLDQIETLLKVLEDSIIR